MAKKGKYNKKSKDRYSVKRTPAKGGKVRSGQKQIKKEKTVRTDKVVDDRKVSKRNIIVAVIAIVIVSFIVFYPSLNNQFTNWDDPTYVVDNEMITGLGPKNLDQIFSKNVSSNYHPLTMLSLAIDYSISGLEPYTFHLTNIIFHLLNTVLVFFFIYLLTKRKIWVAVIVSLFFGIHPMHVESVTWIAERKDVLYTFFFMGALIVYIRYIDTGKWKFYLFASLLFIISMLSKAVAVTLPLVFIMLDYYRGRGFTLRSVLEKVPLLILSVLFGVIAVKAQAGAAIADFSVFEFHHRIYFASYGFIMYIGKLFVPLKLSTFYPYPFLNENGNLPLIFYIAPYIVLAILVLVFLSARKTKHYIFGIVFYSLTVALVLQFVSVGRVIIADRYAYVPYIGLFFIIGHLFDRVNSSPAKSLSALKYIFPAGLVALALWFSVITWERTKVWKNSETLWTDVISKYPSVDVAYKNRGNYYGKELNQPDRALKDYEVLVAMKSKDPDVYSNLGNIYGLKNEFEKSIEAYTRSLQLDSLNFGSYLNRAITYSKMRDFENAMKDYEKAARLKPNSDNLLSNRTHTYLETGQIDKAIADYNTLINKNARFENLYFRRGYAYFLKGEYEKALQDFLTNIKVYPGYKEAYYNTSVTYFKLEKYQEAMNYATKARSMGYNVKDSYLNQVKAKL